MLGILAFVTIPVLLAAVSRQVNEIEDQRKKKPSMLSMRTKSSAFAATPVVPSSSSSTALVVFKDTSAAPNPDAIPKPAPHKDLIEDEMMKGKLLEG